MSVAIIGGGLAGTACAYVLGQAGVGCTIFEAAATLAAGASGNMRAIYNPRLSAFRSVESDFYTAGFSAAVQTFRQLSDIGFQRCGSLHMITDDDKRKKLSQTMANWNWHPDHMQWLTREEAGRVAGIALLHDALYLPDSGCVEPVRLCKAYALQADIRFNNPVAHLERAGKSWLVNGEAFEIVILANAAAVQAFEIASWLPVHTVRGQVIEVEETSSSSALRCNLCYGGYISPSLETGRHVVGSTFQRWWTHTDILEEDNDYILNNLRRAVPSSGEMGAITGARAALRTSSKDRLPVIGALPGLDNIYVSTAHGSHGVVSSLAGAQMIASDILQLSPPSFKEALAPKRFLR